MSNAVQKRKGKLHFGYLVVFTLILTSFAPLSLGLSCAGIFYPAVATHLGVGKGVLSYYTSFIWIAATIALPALGKCLAKVDARICVSGSIVIIALVFVWLAFTDSLIHFYIGAFVMGIGVAMLLYLAPSTLVNRWFSRRAGFYIGLIMAFTGVGGAVWSAVGGILINTFGWSQTYIVFAIISAVTLPAGIFCMASRPSDKGLLPCGAEETDDIERGSEQTDNVEVAGVPARAAFKMPVFFLILIVCFTLNFGLYAGIMIPSYVNSMPIGLELPLLGSTAAALCMVGQTLSKIVLGYTGEKKPYSSAVIAVVLGLAGLGLLCVHNTTALIVYVASFMFGIYYGVANVMMPLFTRRAFGDKDYPTIYARISMSAAIANIAAALVWGTIIEATGSYLYMYGGVGVILVLTVVLLSVMSKMSRQPHTEA